MCWLLYAYCESSCDIVYKSVYSIQFLKIATVKYTEFKKLGQTLIIFSNISKFPNPTLLLMDFSLGHCLTDNDIETLLIMKIWP